MNIQDIKDLMHQVFNYPWLPRTLYTKDGSHINCDYGPDREPKFGKDSMEVHSYDTKNWITVLYDKIKEII